MHEEVAARCLVVQNTSRSTMRCSAQVDKFTTKSVPHIRIDRLPEILLRVAPYMPITRPAPHMIICVQLQLHRNTAGQSRFLQRQGSEQESSPPRLEASRCRQPEDQLNFRSCYRIRDDTDAWSNSANLPSANPIQT